MSDNAEQFYQEIGFGSMSVRQLTAYLKTLPLPGTPTGDYIRTKIVQSQEMAYILKKNAMSGGQ